MQIYLLRHGIAEDLKAGGRDSDRKLTPEGKRKLRPVVRRAKEAGVHPGLILSSPYARAVETAEIAAAEFEYKGKILQTSTLVPEGHPADVWSEIRIHRDEPQLLLAGHEPLFSQLTSFLLGAPSLLVDFKKGALIRIDVEAFGHSPRGLLKWMLAPKLV